MDRDLIEIMFPSVLTSQGMFIEAVGGISIFVFAISSFFSGIQKKLILSFNALVLFIYFFSTGYFYSGIIFLLNGIFLSSTFTPNKSSENNALASLLFFVVSIGFYFAMNSRLFEVFTCLAICAYNFFPIKKVFSLNSVLVFLFTNVNMVLVSIFVYHSLSMTLLFIIKAISVASFVLRRENYKTIETRTVIDKS